MKYLNVKYIVLTSLFSTVFNVISLYARKHPPNPYTGGLDDNVRVGEGAIDNFVPLLFFGAMLLGIWAINKYKFQNT